MGDRLRIGADFDSDEEGALEGAGAGIDPGPTPTPTPPPPKVCSSNLLCRSTSAGAEH